jgi:mono/diheme cytochrome c family protein
MVATTAFVLGFVVVGLLVFFVAMRGGPRGANAALHSQAPRARVLSAGIIAAIAVLFGVGIPVAIGIGNGTTAEDNGPGGVELSSSEIAGRRLFAQNCATCHTLEGAAAVGKVGPNLDQLRPPKVLVLNAIQVGRAAGRGQMPAELLTGRDAQDVAQFVAAVAGH